MQYILRSIQSLNISTTKKLWYSGNRWRFCRISIFGKLVHFGKQSSFLLFTFNFDNTSDIKQEEIFHSKMVYNFQFYCIKKSDLYSCLIIYSVTQVQSNIPLYGSTAWGPLCFLPYFLLFNKRSGAPMRLLTREQRTYDEIAKYIQSLKDFDYRYFVVMEQMKMTRLCMAAISPFPKCIFGTQI